MATLGYTGTGDTDGIGSSTGIFMAKVVATENGTITSISVYSRGSFLGSTTDLRVAIYSDNAGVPLNKLAESAGAATTDSETPEWEEIAISLAITNGVTYWLACEVANADSVQRYLDATGNASLGNGPGYPTWPDPWTELFALSRQYSIYATYTPPGNVNDLSVNLGEAQIGGSLF